MTFVRTLVLVLCLALAAGACATRGGTPRPRPFPGATLPPGQTDTGPVPEQAAGPGEDAEAGSHAVAPGDPPDVVRTALELLGVPYRFGGSDPSGFDCSGLVQYVFAQVGVRLPRSARDQHAAGEEIDLEDAEPGDLLFYEIGNKVDHVAIYLGDGEALHAPARGRSVIVASIELPYWKERFVDAVRVLD